MAVETREERKNRITGERQDQILAAALAVFSDLGFGRATIPDIAREADIAVGTIYNYYQSKRELLVAIVKKYVIESFTSVLDELPDEDDSVFISTILENRLSLGLENAGTFLPLFEEIQRDPELRRTFTDNLLHPVMKKIENYIAGRVAEGVFRDVNPEMVTRAIGGLVIGFTLLHRIEGEKSPVYQRDHKKLANELAELILNGLLKTKTLGVGK